MKKQIREKNKINKKDIVDYFRSNLFESISAYNAWKMVVYSKSKEIFSEEMARRYLEIQKYHSSFFPLIERTFLSHFVLMSLHSFDKTNNSFSLYMVDELKTENFVKKNFNVISDLRNIRNKIFAHRDIERKKYKLPPLSDLNNFFENLKNFYNNLTRSVDSSLTRFENAEEIKYDIELLFMNLYRGESIRKKEICIKYDWEGNCKKELKDL